MSVDTFTHLLLPPHVSALGKPLLSTHTSPRVPQRVFSHPPHSHGPMHGSAQAQAHMQGSASLQPRGHPNGDGENCIPTPRLSDCQASDRAKGFHTFVAALQLVGFPWKHDNSSIIVWVVFFLLVILNERLNFQGFSFWNSLQFN